MASKKVNITIPAIPEFEVKLEGDWIKASRVINGLPASIKKGYDSSALKISRAIMNIVKRAIKTGIPPSNSGVRWPALSPNTIRVHGQHNIYNLTGLYSRSIGMYTYKNRTIVGLPINRSLTDKNLTLNQLAIILEHGSKVNPDGGGGSIPPRPLWAPSYKSYGGPNKLKKVIISEIRKSILRDHGIRPNQIRLS